MLNSAENINTRDHATVAFICQIHSMLKSNNKTGVQVCNMENFDPLGIREYCWHLACYFGHLWPGEFAHFLCI
jgi:hypothetical protein